MAVDANRQELAEFLRNRRSRIAPGQVGLPTGVRRRTTGLRREEVAVLAGVSPTWYTYLEQGRDITPSRQVLDSLARILRLTEDERRYMHTLALGNAFHGDPLEADIAADDLIRQTVAAIESPYPIYAADHYCRLLAWNRAACEWYDDWAGMADNDRNMMRWMVTSPIARSRLVDWEAETKDSVARLRAEAARHLDDPPFRELVHDLQDSSEEFAVWWADHDVVEHRTRIRRLRHDVHGELSVRLVPMYSWETIPVAIIFHVPMEQ